WHRVSRRSYVQRKRLNPGPGPRVKALRLLRGLGGAAPALDLLAVRIDRFADLLERAADETGDVHLRDADLLRDLRLREALEEAQLQDHALALVERLEPRREHGAVLRHLVLVLLGADRLERIERLLPVAARRRRQRERRVRAAGFERLEHFLFLRARSLGELRDRRRASELHRELLDNA